jgi:hypothetical protein
LAEVPHTPGTAIALLPVEEFAFGFTYVGLFVFTYSSRLLKLRFSLHCTSLSNEYPGKFTFVAMHIFEVPFE